LQFKFSLTFNIQNNAIPQDDGIVDFNIQLHTLQVISETSHSVRITRINSQTLQSSALQTRMNSNREPMLLSHSTVQNSSKRPSLRPGQYIYCWQTWS